MDESSQSDPALVSLDAYEVSWAQSVGFYRFSESERDGKTQSDGSNDANGARNHQQGAAGELALTKFLEMKWNATVNTYNNFPDLDGNLECRSKQDYQLYMRLYPGRDRAKGSAIFVSVTCLHRDLSSFRIDGWTIGAEVMQQQYLKTNSRGKKEFQYPLTALRSVSTLKRETEKRVSVVRRGREKYRDWVTKTLERDIE